MKHFVAIALVTGSLCSCAGLANEAAHVKAALEEREAASARLAKAIAAYCGAKTEILETRQNCVLEKQLEVLRTLQAGEGTRSNQAGLDAGTFNAGRDDRALALLNCEHTRTHTICRRPYPALAELDKRRPLNP